jgi:ribose transport system substrate-binding protein
MHLSPVHREEVRPSRLRRRLALGAWAVATAVFMAACSSGGSSTPGSSGSSGSSGSPSVAADAAGVALAEKAVAQWEKPPTWQGPTARVNAKAARGKTVDLVNLTEEIPALHEWAAVAMALDNEFIHTYIQQANAAGIKVITAQTGTPGLPQGTGAVAEVTFDYPQVGKILGAWFAADSKCTGYPQIITTTSSRQPSAAEVAGIQSAISQYCPSSAALPVQNVLIPDWATNLPTVTRSTLTSNASIDHMLPLYDGMTIYMLPAIQQLNLSRKVAVGSFNATPVVMKNDLAKQSALSADVGGPNDWYAYALADEILRVATGAPVIANEHVPLRLFTRDNLSTINLSASESTWYGTVNFACEYDKLWGAACS